MLRSIQKTARAYHDKFFKRVFSESLFIRDLLSLAFTKAELSVFDLNHIRLEKDSWVNRIADLVISLPLKNYPNHRIKIFIVLEHKSQYNKDFFNQLYTYQYSIHEYILRQGGYPCPVYCVVFYHGKSPWRYPKSFQEGLWGEIFAKNPLFPRKGLIDYDIRLVDARKAGFRSLIKSLKAYAPLNLMERIWYLKGVSGEIKRAVSLFGEFSGKRKDLILDVMEYLENAGVIGSREWVSLEKELLMEGTFKQGGFMNIREEIEQRGFQQGREQGMQQGMQQVALNMMKNNLELSFISKITGLSQEEIKKFKNGK